MNPWTSTPTSYIHKPVMTFTTDDYYREMTDCERVSTVAEVVAALYGIPAHKVFTKARHNVFCYARHAVRYIMRKEFKWGPLRIAKAMGCDHTTVVHSVRTAKNLIDTDAGFRRRLELCLQTVKDGG